LHESHQDIFGRTCMVTMVNKYKTKIYVYLSQLITFGHPWGIKSK